MSFVRTTADILDLGACCIGTSCNDNIHVTVNVGLTTSTIQLGDNQRTATRLLQCRIRATTISLGITAAKYLTNLSTMTGNLCCTVDISTRVIHPVSKLFYRLTAVTTTECVFYVVASPNGDIRSRYRC